MVRMIYQNRYNHNKYMDIAVYACGHYYASQYMEWDTDHGMIRNWNGNTRNRRRRRAIRKEQLVCILADYTCVHMEAVR